MRRYCPQCGHRVGPSVATNGHASYADADGFCQPHNDGIGGCSEHLLRFDPETGARLAPLPENLRTRASNEHSFAEREYVRADVGFGLTGMTKLRRTS